MRMDSHGAASRICAVSNAVAMLRSTGGEAVATQYTGERGICPRVTSN